MTKALVLRTSKADGTSHNGFTWPTSGPVECDDWNPQPICGGGLHGLLWGEGNWGLLHESQDALWQVVEVDTESIVKIDNEKVKFPRGTVIYSGGMAEAITMVLNHRKHFEETLAEILANSKKDTAASSGNSSTAASSGDYSKAASSGNSSTAASSGDYSKAASSGNSSTAASSGYSSTAASSGDSSKAASSGNYSKAASSGDYSKAAATGKNTIAMAAGIDCTVQAGENGCFAAAYYDEKTKRNRILIAHVGEKSIQADTPYCIVNGKWKIAQ